MGKYSYFLGIDISCLASLHPRIHPETNRNILRDSPFFILWTEELLKTQDFMLNLCERTCITVPPVPCGTCDDTHGFTYLEVRVACYQRVLSANPGPVSHAALTSRLITALTALEVWFCTPAAISFLFRPRCLTSCHSQSCHLRFTFTRPVSSPSLKASCLTSHLSSCLDN